MWTEQDQVAVGNLENRARCSGHRRQPLSLDHGGYTLCLLTADLPGRDRAELRLESGQGSDKHSAFYSHSKGCLLRERSARNLRNHTDASTSSEAICRRSRKGRRSSVVGCDVEYVSNCLWRDLDISSFLSQSLHFSGVLPRHRKHHA
jgi:hypothetical protein